MHYMNRRLLFQEVKVQFATASISVFQETLWINVQYMKTYSLQVVVDIGKQHYWSLQWQLQVSDWYSVHLA